MTQYNTLNVKLFDSQLNKVNNKKLILILVTLSLLSNIVRDSEEEHSFPQKSLFTKTKVSKLRKAFGNNSLAYIKLSKTQLHKIVKSGGFLGILLGLLLKTGLPLIGNVLKPLATSVLIPLGLTAASATDAFIYKKMFGSGMCPLDIRY